MVKYEWDVETVEEESGDVLDHNHCDSFREAIAAARETPDDGCRFDVVLVRDDDDGRSWAYLDDGKLPTHFLDAYEHEVAKVPQRFVKEVG